MDNSKQLETTSIPSLLLKFSIPAIIGMLVNASYNMIDRIFIGQGVGFLGIAGITIGFPFMILMMAFGMLIGLGTTALVSIRLGQKKDEEAELILGNGFVLLVGITLSLSLIGLVFLRPILVLFGASTEVLPYATQYLRIILWGGVFQSLGFGLNNVIRAEGNPRIAMATMLIAALLNIILDPIFIFVLDMGIQGAAIATVIAQAVAAIWVLSYFFSKHSTLKIRRENLTLSFPIVKNILAIGSAPFSMQVAASVLTLIMNRSLYIYGGDLAISTMGIVNSLAMMILMPIFGINQGAQPIIGYNYGAKKFDRVKEALKLAIIAATAIVILGFTVTRLIPNELVALFNNDDQDLINMGSHAITVFFVFLPLIGFQIVSANYFQAVGKPKQAMFLSLSRQVILLIPAVLILPKFFGLNGLFMAGPIADIGSSMLTGLFLYRELKNLDFQHEQGLIPEPQGIK